MIGNLKKALGLGASIALVISVFGSTSASGTVSGHFTSDAPSGKTEAILTATTGGGSTHFLTMHSNGSAMTCHSITYTGSMSGSTVQVIQAQANFFGCTVGEGTGSVTTNGCGTELWSRTSGHGTVKLTCPAGKKVEVHSPNCIQKFPEQFPSTGGVTYKTITANGKHAITAELTVEGLKFEQHSGLCVFMGTNGNAILTGAVIVHGIDASTKEGVNITAT